MSAAPRKPTAAAPARAAKRPATSGAFAWNAASTPEPAWLLPLAYAAMALFAGVIVFMITGPHRIGDIFTETDFYGAYGLGARMIERGHFDPTRYAVVGPVHEVTLALFGFVIRDLFLAAEVLSALAMLGATYLWFRVLRERANGVVACAAVWFLVTNGSWLRYGYSATTDALALGLQAAFAFALFTGALTPRRLLAAGALAALAFLTRYNAVVLLPAGLLALLAGWTGTQQPRGRAALLFAAGFLALVVPWVTFSMAHGGHAGIQLHHNVAYEVFARANGISWDTYERTMQSQFPTPWSVFARDPGAVTLHMVLNFFDHARLDATNLTGWPLALLALLGLALGARDTAMRALRPVLAMCLLLYLTLVPAFHSERYSLAVLPGWALLAGVAIGTPRLALAVSAGAGRQVWLKPVLALLVAVLAAQMSFALQKKQVGYLPTEALEIARTVKPLLRPGDKVMARKSYFAWHAGLEPVPFPFADSLSQIAAVARREHVRWLYFSWPEAELRSDFDYLLDTLSAVPGLTPRAVTRHNPAVLYEIGPDFGREPAWAGNDTTRAMFRARAKALITTNDWHSRLIVALDWQKRGRYDLAQPLLDEAQHLAPDDMAVLLTLGDNLVHLGSARAAGAVFQHAEQLEPGNAYARIGRGWAALTDGDTQAAAELWRPVVSFADDPATLERMLQLYTTLGDAATASTVRARLADMGIRR